MTTLTEMVEQEAARAENEEPESEPEEEAAAESGESEPEDEPEPEEEQPEALAAIGEAEIRKAEKAIEGQRKKLAAIFGEEAVAHDCLLCSGLGFMPELPPLGTRFTFVQGEDGPALNFDAPEPEPEYRQATDKETCSECGGFGQTLTGAKKPAQVLWQCGACNGSGFIQTGAIVVSTAPTAPPAPYEPAPIPQVDVGLAPDQWGRPAGHQHWGVPPALIAG